MTATSLAEKCGFSKQNMQRFLNGEVHRSKHFPVLAQSLGVSLTWLTVGDPGVAPTWWQESGTAEAGASAVHQQRSHPDMKASWSVISVSTKRITFDNEEVAGLIVETKKKTNLLNKLVWIRIGSHDTLRRVGKTINAKTIVTETSGRNSDLVSAAQLEKALVVTGIIFQD